MKGKMTISRPSYGNDKECISITVKDDLSRTRFLDIEVGYAQFAQLLTGLSEVECDFKVRGLQNVGKNIEKRDLCFVMPVTDYDKRRAVADKLAAKNSPKGWTPSLYWGSKSSFRTVDGVEMAFTTISRWVDIDQTK